jgi:uncharacterized membrane protein YgdD (TMEM256/DUF423 family)
MTFDNSNQYRSAKNWIAIGAIIAALAIGMGAFGAHGLQSYLDELANTDAALAVRRLDNWRTAANYQMYHAFGIVVVGIAMMLFESRLLKIAAAFFLVGTFLFSGSLYALVLSEVRVLGAVTPLGGLSFIVGWTLFAIAAIKGKPFLGNESMDS